MSDEVKKHLTDVVESIQIINEYIGEVKRFDDYKSNRQLKDAIDLRNKVIHTYDSIDDVTFGRSSSTIYPTLHEEVKSLLKVS